MISEETAGRLTYIICYNVIPKWFFWSGDWWLLILHKSQKLCVGEWNGYFMAMKNPMPYPGIWIRLDINYIIYTSKICIFHFELITYYIKLQPFVTKSHPYLPKIFFIGMFFHDNWFTSSIQIIYVKFYHIIDA